MLSRIKLDLEATKRALLDVDDNKLTQDELRAISRQLPTPEEVGGLHPFRDLRSENAPDHPDQGF
jgi:diaphanous 1